MTPTNQKPRESLEYWQLVNAHGEIVEVHSLRGVFHTDADKIRQVVPKEELDRVSKERDEAIHHAAIHNEQMHKAERERDQYLETIQTMSETAKNKAVLDAEAFRSSYAEIQRLTARVKELEASLAIDDACVLSLTAENETLKRELAEAKAECKRYKELYEDYSQEVEEMQLERNEARSEVERLKSELLEVQTCPSCNISTLSSSGAKACEEAMAPVFAELAAQKERAEKWEREYQNAIREWEGDRKVRDRAMHALEYAKSKFSCESEWLAEIERLLKDK